MTTIEGIQPSRYFRLQQLYELVEWWQECLVLSRTLFDLDQTTGQFINAHWEITHSLLEAERAVLEFKIED